MSTVTAHAAVLDAIGDLRRSEAVDVLRTVLADLGATAKPATAPAPTIRTVVVYRQPVAPEAVDTIRRLASERHADREIAEQLGLTIHQVRTVRQRHQIAAGGRGRSRPRKGCPSEGQYNRHRRAGEDCQACREYMSPIWADRKRKQGGVR